MKKKFLLQLMLIGAICFSMAGCASTKDKDDTGDTLQKPTEILTPTEAATPAVTLTPVPTAVISPQVASLTEKEFAPSKENVKFLGRTYLLGETLWLSYSASGIEFTMTGTKAEITFIGDNIAFPGTGEGHYCRVGIFVNDTLVADELINDREKTITAYESDTEETVKVRVVKLSESSDSTIGIGKIKVVSKDVIKPTEPKNHRIEFIGDSITCGYGVDDIDLNLTYTTATENAAKTYAYKTAQALDTDFSLVAMSGYGIISGYTGNGTQNSSQIIPAYYNKMGNSYGYFNGNIQVSSIEWDFSRFVPELIVINLGTNDYSYTKNDTQKQAEFTAGYIEFLKQVREKNPEATLLCTLGIMGDTLYPCIEEAVSSYCEETGDSKIHSMKFDVQQVDADGRGTDWHPSDKTHTKAADKLTAEIKNIMGW